MAARVGGSVPGRYFTNHLKTVHTVSRNASKTKPATFVACVIKSEGSADRSVLSLGL